MLAKGFRLRRARESSTQRSDIPNPLQIHVVVDAVFKHLSFVDAYRASGVNRLWRKTFQLVKWKGLDLTGQRKFGNREFKLVLRRQRYGKRQCLQNLSLIGSSVDSRTFTNKLKLLTGISVLELSGIQVKSEETFIQLRALYNLEVLTIIGSSAVKASSLHLIKDVLGGLSCLHVPDSERLDDDCLREISLNCGRLKCLNIRSCSQVTDTGLKPVLKTCTEIECLDLTDTMTMSYLSCMDIRVFSRNLKYIKAGRTRLSGCGCDLLVLAANEKKFNDFYLGVGDHNDTDCSSKTQLSHCIRNWTRFDKRKRR